MAKQEYLPQVQQEIRAGLDFVNTKRQILRDRLVKYVEQNKDTEKVGVNTIYATMQLYMAIMYSDELSVIVEPRKFGDEEYADNLTDLASFDYDEMRLGRIKYAKDWDMLFFGVALRDKRGWDSKRSVVKV